MSAHEVHEAARDVLRCWFEETPAAKRFAKDAALDAEIGLRFGDLRKTLLDTHAEGWTDAPDTLLAAIIVIDQFSRNLFRGQAEAFAGDALARSLTRQAMRHAWDTGMSGEERAFLYMPLMHSENVSDQDASIAAFAELGIAENLKFAQSHRAVIVDYGRFPSRNAALGRASTPAELDYLSRPDAGW